MSRILTIAKKEFVDHISDQTFLVSFGILLIVMLTGAYTQIFYTQNYILQETTAHNVLMEGQAWMIQFINFTMYISRPFAHFGAFIAIALSFNSINKERIEGSFKVLLSYPIHRYEIIYGKILGSFFVISLMTVVSMTISISLLIFYLVIPVTYDFLFRAGSVVSAGIFLLMFYLCIGIAISTIVRDTTKALIGILLVIFFVGTEGLEMCAMIWSWLAPILGERFSLGLNFRFNPGIDLYFNSDASFLTKFSPKEAFLSFSNNIMHFLNQVQPTAGGNTFIPTSFEWLFPRNMFLIQSLFLFTLISFILCYFFVMRNDLS